MEKFRSRESNQNKQNKTHNTTSLLPELNIEIPSQNLNQNSLKDTSTLIKRSYADVLVNGNEVVNDGANETKAVEETKIDERNITDNRTRRNKDKDNREEKRDGNLEKIDLEKIYFQLLEEEQSKRGERNKSTPPIISTNSSQLKNDPGFSLIEGDIFSTQNKEFLSVLEELQNANFSNNIYSTTRHPTACTPPEKKQYLWSLDKTSTRLSHILDMV